VLEAAGGALSPATDTLAPTTDPVAQSLAPVTGPVGDVLAPVVGSLADAAAPVLAPATQPLAPVVGAVVDPILPGVVPPPEPMGPVQPGASSPGGLQAPAGRAAPGMGAADTRDDGTGAPTSPSERQSADSGRPPASPALRPATPKLPSAQPERLSTLVDVIRQLTGGESRGTGTRTPAGDLPQSTAAGQPAYSYAPFVSPVGALFATGGLLSAGSGSGGAASPAALFPSFLWAAALHRWKRVWVAISVPRSRSRAPPPLPG
jgi:hypothetical protein